MTRPLLVRLDGSTALSRDILGNKAFGINEMRRHDLPVPPAFCVTTAVCTEYLRAGPSVLDRIWSDVMAMMQWLEAETGRTFGAGPRPLLVSVRSGATQSMPGMLDTVLNLGFHGAVEESLATSSGRAFADDLGHRFTESYQRIVLGQNSDAVPADPRRQLRGAIEAVFASWHSERAITYRRHHRLGDDGGTAVVVQAMVFGNLGADSGTGVLFSRNPSTGDSAPFGEWLRGGQGEDVVSGTSDVAPLSALASELPAVYEQLLELGGVLERLRADPQDIEYTVESGRLWLLQTRSAKRSAHAAVRWALQLYDEGLITAAEALGRVTSDHIDTVLAPALQPEIRLAAPLLARGLAAAPGVATGRAYADVDDAIDAAEAGEEVILVRAATSPDDIHGMIAAAGIVTETGGATSHAAVVSREIGRPTVVGCGPGVSDSIVGRLVTVDGDAGEVRDGILPMSAWSEDDHPDLRQLRALVMAHTVFRAHQRGDFPALHDIDSTTVAEALASGHTEVVCSRPLVAMLTAAQLNLA